MKQARGFTLIELAIVLVIITILIGGLAMPLSAQIQARRIAETNRTLEEAREALMGYAMSRPASSSSCTCTYTVGDTGTCPTVLSSVTPSACTSLCPPAGNMAWTPSCPATGTGPLTITLPIARHYLPCPDLSGVDPEPNLDNDGVDGLTDLNNGVEDRRPGTPVGSPYVAGAACAASSSDPASSTGNLPWVTLGSAAQDAWGNRLRYMVTASFADSSTGFSSTNNGNLQVCSASGCAAVNVAGNVPAVLVSYGPNGWGGRNINGSTLAAPTSADEKENTNTDVNFVSRTPSKAGDASGEFDDLVVWISDSLLKSRVCPAGGCP